MKDSQYLTHDIGARNDPKLIELQMEMGGQGLAIFWCLVEMLWENEGYIPANYKSIAFVLRWCSPEEVRRVVEDFELFQVENDKIFSRSALDRITHKKATIEAKREGGRRGGQRRAENQSESIPSSIPSSIPEGNLQGNPALINKLINKQINKDNINNNAPTALDIFEIFFFIRNFKDPSGETKRFFEHYEGRHWTYQDGTPVVDWSQAAKDWKPLKAGTRWDQEAVNWYRAVWNAARGHIANADMIFLYGLKNIHRDGQKLALRYVNENTARLAAAFICDNSLAGDYQIDFRVSN